MTKTVAVLGSSSAPEDSQVYQDAYQIGTLLANAGFAVITGGYKGVMEAASKGAYEANGKVIGAVSKVIEDFRVAQPNPYIHETIGYSTLHERLLHIILNADAYVVMPGGVGTLNELILAWELLRVRDLTDRPIICYGDFWLEGLASLKNNTFISELDWSILQFVSTTNQMIEIIKTVNT